MPVSSKTLDEIVDILFTLTSFETFDMLAGPAHSIQEVVPVVQRLARAAIELSEEHLTSSNSGHGPFPTE
jgi:hypothetical protein